MSNVSTMIKKVQAALDSPIDMDKLNKAIIEMHSALSDENYVIKDPLVRREMEQMVVSYTVRRMLEQS